MKRTKIGHTVDQKRWYSVGLFLTFLSLAAALILTSAGLFGIRRQEVNYDYDHSAVPVRFFRAGAEEEYDDDYTRCTVDFVSANEKYHYVKEYTKEEWDALPADAVIEGSVATDYDGTTAAFGVPDPTGAEILAAFQAARVEAQKGVFNAALACGLVCVGFAIMTFFGAAFSLYERVWFLSILVLAAVFAILFPEEDVNGVNGILIMALYLADTLLNILCELLISKQSKWNFLVSIGVELTEILICVLLAYRFATMAVTLFFWLPIDILSFVNWNRHPDRDERELTEVRRLRGKQEALVIAGIVVWTVGIGYLLTKIDLGTDLFGGNEALEIAVCYLDACASAVGVANGLFIFFRFREQWIAWYLCALLEAAMNILSGQPVLLILKLGYLTNTTYGYIKWTRYIEKKKEDLGKEESPS